MDVGGGPRERRKEVALGRLRTVSLILILGAWDGATKGAAPDDAAAAPSMATRQAPPAPPIRYLEAGANLFNSAQFDLASKYLEAANRYRDQLLPDEQSTLDAYLKELTKVQRVTNPPAATPASAATPAPAVGPAQPAASAPMPVGGDTKQKGRWLLHESREQLLLGNYDAAQRKADEAEALDVKWGLFDDTPAKVQEAIKKARPNGVTTAAGSAAGQPHDRKAAKAKLRSKKKERKVIKK